MLKKRIIFTLLYDRGNFMLSRNFRLQRVGSIEWLQKHYDFSQISFYIDELIVLDVTRGGRDTESFCQVLRALTNGCFVPIAAGGGVETYEHALALLRSGADKIVVNSSIFDQPQFVHELCRKFGQQCVVGSVDLKLGPDGLRYPWITNGSVKQDKPLHSALQCIGEGALGELYLNSIDRDGTGQGYDFAMLDELPGGLSIPVILAGGAGNALHLAAGLADKRVNAVATAHLFNFIGDGLMQARKTLEDAGVPLAKWIRTADLNVGAID